MRGTAEQLREGNPGKWLLIRLDGPEAEAGELVAAHEDPEGIDRELAMQARKGGTLSRPLYVTFSVAEGKKLPPFAF
jgi:hypothetical protein